MAQGKILLAQIRCKHGLSEENQGRKKYIKMMKITRRNEIIEKYEITKKRVSTKKTEKNPQTMSHKT